MKKQTYYLLIACAALFAACSPTQPETPDTGIDLPDWYYTGGTLGTSFLTASNCFQQPTPAVDKAGMVTRFNQGDQLAEKIFTANQSGTRSGLGPAYVRSSCQHCHPGYSHGQSVGSRYETQSVGNGTLLVVYDDNSNYVGWLAGMPQLHAVAPFKAPVDESQIIVNWLYAVDKHNNTFPDGEKYELIYPEVILPPTAIYVYNRGYNELGNYTVRLENTIGIYGTGLLDAIPDDSIVAQWAREENALTADGHPILTNGLNTTYFERGQWKSYYTNAYKCKDFEGDGKQYVRRYTYAMSRGPLQDGAGANAAWNIPNVTRRDRRTHYQDAKGTYALYSSKDPEVQVGFDDFIANVDPERTHSEWFEGDMETRIYSYLTSDDLPVEMNDEEFTAMMVWHRGLAVPAARNVNDPQVLRGRELFSQIGCDFCHRPSWTTGRDDISDPNRFFTDPNTQLPRYPNQTIWPYTDMVQHKLMMVNDIRTGWCRTTPLWGRGLHRKATGDASEARMHDTRARNVIEAIMWHGYSEQSDAWYPTEQFYNLPKEDRDAIVAFINAI